MPEILASSAIGTILTGDAVSPQRVRDEIVGPWVVANRAETPIAPDLQGLVVVGLGGINQVLDRASESDSERKAFSEVPLLLNNGDPNPELRRRVLTNAPDLASDLDRNIILLGTAHTGANFIDGAQVAAVRTDAELSVTYSRPVPSIAMKTVGHMLVAPSAVTEMSLESVMPLNLEFSSPSLVFGAKLDSEGTYPPRSMFTAVSFLNDTSNTHVVGVHLHSIDTVSARPRSPMPFGQWERLDNMRQAIRAATPRFL